jgi:hypothetical protein
MTPAFDTSDMEEYRRNTASVYNFVANNFILSDNLTRNALNRINSAENIDELRNIFLEIVDDTNFNEEAEPPSQ